MKFDNFIKISTSVENLDVFVIRTAIKSSIDWAIPFFGPKLLDVGCGKMPYRNYILSKSNVSSYIGLDIENAIEYDKTVKPDFTWDGKTMPFESGIIDTAIGTELLEHCPKPEIVLTEICRVLKEDGVFFFTVPFLWNLHEVPNDEYRYTPFSLERHLINSGFKEIIIKPTGGWHASMAQMLGLWVRRSPMKRNMRKILSLILKPIIYYLLKKDKNLNIDFTEGKMITGLYGIARK